MSCPETHPFVIAQLCGLHYYPGVSRPCQYDCTCNKHFARWLASEPEVLRLHKEYLATKEPVNET